MCSSDLSKILSELWPYGFATVGDFTFQSAAYCARYITKKITGNQAHEHYSRVIESTGELVQLEPEYCTMSRRPGLGRNWYEKYKDDCYPSNYLIRDGNKLPIPRYYDKLLEREDECLHAQIKVARKIKAISQKQDSTPDRLRARELCKVKQAETLTRSKI